MGGYSIKLPGVIFVTQAATAKLAPVRMDAARDGKLRPEPSGPYVSATYASIDATCPASCPFKGNGCFAQSGFIKRFTNPLDEQAREHHLSGLDVALNEAALIERFARHGVPQDGARGGRDLRLHIGGDVADLRSTAVLAEAARVWLEHDGGAVWTYTHRWRQIPRNTWGAINVFASCETLQEARDAQARGYRASITLHPGMMRGPTRQEVDGELVIPCPWETRGITCNNCRLCLDSQPAGVIGFHAHGSSGERAMAIRALNRKRRVQLEIA